MLPAAHRLTEGEAFRHTVRAGRRAGTQNLVVHLLVEAGGSGPAQAGFVVSKAVGNAVVRNRVKRRLRHLTREHLAGVEALPGRAVLAVRALPPAAGASYAELARDLERCLDKALPVPSSGTRAP